MLICQHCGHESPEDAKVCPKCGSSLSPQFSTRFLQPPDSYRSRQFPTQPPTRAYPTHQFSDQFFSPSIAGTHSAFPDIRSIVWSPGLFGTSSLIMGIASVASGVLGWMLPIASVVLGIIAIPLGATAMILRQRSGATGFVLGITGLILGLLWIFIFSVPFHGVSG